MTHNSRPGLGPCPRWCTQESGHVDAHYCDIDTVFHKALTVAVTLVGDLDGNHIRFHVTTHNANTFFDVMPDAAEILGRAVVDLPLEDVRSLGHILIAAAVLVDEG